MSKYISWGKMKHDEPGKERGFFIFVPRPNLWISWGGTVAKLVIEIGPWEYIKWRDASEWRNS